MDFHASFTKVCLTVTVINIEAFLSAAEVRTMTIIITVGNVNVALRTDDST